MKTRDVATLLEQSASRELPDLAGRLRQRPAIRDSRHLLPRIICRALIARGRPGVKALRDSLLESAGVLCREAVLDALWCAARGELPSPYLNNFLPSTHSLMAPAPAETQRAANDALTDIVFEAQRDRALFDVVFHFVDRANAESVVISNPDADGFSKQVFALLGESAIRITRRLIDEFTTLVDQENAESVYQTFLYSNPVFLDPLAAAVLSQISFAGELRTDFVIQRLDNQYVVVEIEKPQDRIFTNASDFTAEFTHAFGQVIDFQEWVDQNPDFLRKRNLPEITNPRGLLVIGKRKNLTKPQQYKLRRFCANSRMVDVLAFDDLIVNAQTLYSNLLRYPHR